MALPEPTPKLRGKDAQAFQSRLRKFKLTKAQEQLYAGAEDEYLASLKKQAKK